MKITNKIISSPSGKVKSIDIYSGSGSIISYIFYNKTDVKPDDQLDQIIPLLDKMAKSPKASIKQYNLTVWGSIFSNSAGIELYSISIPENAKISSEIFYEPLTDKENYCDMRITALKSKRDRGFPLARYENGTIYVYVKNENELYHPKVPIETNIEFRFYRVKDPEERKTADYSYFRKYFKYLAPKRQDLSTYRRNKAAAYKALRILGHPLTGYVSYRFFKRMVERDFGFNVSEVGSEVIRGYGATFCDFPDSEQKVGITILIASDLPTHKKLVILCHEFCHALLHFPIYYADRFIEKLSWAIPDIELFYEKTKQLTLSTRRLEAQADRFTSRFLIPPRREEVPKSIFSSEGFTLPHYLLNWLLFFFPDENKDIYAKGSKGLKAEVNRILNLEEPQTIYERLAFSTLLRVKEIKVSPEVSVKDLKDETTIDLFIERFRRLRKRLLKLGTVIEYSENTKNWTYEKELRFASVQIIHDKFYLKNSDLMDSITWRSPLRKKLSVIAIIPPEREPYEDDTDLFPRIPLIPDESNEEKDLKGKWIPLQPSKKSPAWTIPQWQEFSKTKTIHPGLILYDPFWIFSNGAENE